jgi:SAM-dependent methyltransferase
MSRKAGSAFARVRAFFAGDAARKKSAFPRGRRFESLADYVAEIDAFHAGRPDMDPIRAFNHEMVDALAKARPLCGLRLLDVGASPHGYGLERALHLGVSAYVGIGLAVEEVVDVRDGDRLGWLINSNAEELPFADGGFDAILSVSTFEHFRDGASVLQEMHRALTPGGAALFHFEPVWTSSYGHHLHHYPSIGRLVPPWAHLLWSEEQMRAALKAQWPPDPPITLEAALEWVYRGKDINRLDVIALRRMFDESALEIEWAVPLMDDDTADKPLVASYLSKILPYSSEQLMTRGFAILMRKAAPRG